ncbi:unnamed protein product [Heterobilharzia americana]|nr:unnamed protein product [Heterobilharzia americana]
MSGCYLSCLQDVKCRHLSIPDKYLSACNELTDHRIFRPVYKAGEGLAPNELVLLVSMENTKSCGQSTLAWASFCEKDPRSGR